MRSRLLTAMVLAISVAGAPGESSAGGPTIWDAIAADDASSAQQVYREQMRRADRYAMRIAKMCGDVRARPHLPKLIDTAMNGYKKAIEAAPSSPEPHLRIAEMILAYPLGRRGPAGLQIDCYPTTRDSEWRVRLLYHWEQFEKLAPMDPRLVAYILPSRSLEYTRLGTKEGYRKALRDYELLFERGDLAIKHPGEAARLAGNRAEIHMMLGQMHEAIEWYQFALDYHPEADKAFGLAVAFDRDGHGLRSRELMAGYLSRSSAEQFVHQLAQGNLFFVPQGEVFYYFGLMHETLGNYDLAIDAYRAYIQSGAHPQFHPRARQNIAALQKRLARGEGKRPANHWSRSWHLGGGGNG